MPKLKLTYFDFHGGRGEPARLALSMGGISFEDDRCRLQIGSGVSRIRRSALCRCSKWMGRHSHNRMPSIITVGKLADLYPLDAWQAALCAQLRRQPNR